MSVLWFYSYVLSKIWVLDLIIMVSTDSCQCMGTLISLNVKTLNEHRWDDLYCRGDF